MKAAVLVANEEIRYMDYETPQVKPGTVKIQVRVSGICGSDVPRVLHNGAHYFPIVLGHEFSGVVVEVGEGVTKLKAGDHVTCAPRVPCLKCADCRRGNITQCKQDSFIGSREQGSFAEYIVVPEANAAKFDPSVPFEVAAFFEPATVALHGVQNTGYKGGEYTAVIGGGTIGNFAMQWTKIFGSRKTVVFDLDDDRLALAKEMGADAVINSAKGNVKEQVEELTEGEGFHDVYEVAGANAATVMAFEIAGPKGRVSLIGTCPTDVKFTREQWEMVSRKELMICGTWQGYSTPFPGKEWDLAAHYFATGDLRVTPAFIYKKFPLREAMAAFDLYRNPAQVHGKILLINE